ncbi:SMP-30/gluconolactonase/LRE family protein [Rhodococcus opacus]|uniref:SMP-30/gluconolactonase/LRE family protein n=1 Tax=Rhodococcus opacus TaxID=37919 RepID=UPI0002A3FFF8|nr:SMP-30/gluconolactonase/LRE family protein [Rhodococcus opacus]ELB93198.1 5-valerolactone hydrolase [Rhodococcus wratislaviensis IFP 2016]MDX5965278.1 SMP-30/gluconolactonase/LRE family protein [Rhodococcus opacus]NKY76887.1 SMP-30/gluconolactonase/LRE family protein [Rhodococcus opacus]CAG7618780.1 Virginiamycin B lyase [Rhodococcus opacus]
MTERQLSVVTDGFTYLEGPRWHDGRLWFVDFYTFTVNAVNPDGSVEQIAVVPEQPSGLGWLPDGRMLVVSMKDRKVLRQETDGSLVEHADIWDLCGGHANDMVVAENGQAYVGNFGFDMMAGADHELTTIVLVNTDGSAKVVADGLSFPNGMVISPDGGTLLVNELFGNKISAFDILPDGTLGARRDWASFGDLGDEASVEKRLAQASIVPDGLTMDAEGAVWIADCVNQRAARIAEGGEILDTVSTAPEGVFAVALGGNDGKTLFLCVAPDFDEKARSNAREGRMLATKVDVPHAGRP